MSESRNVWQRINAVKRGLRGVSLKKSGKTPFSNHEYMELNDFENALEDFCDKEGINTMFFWYTDKAILRVTNVEDPSDYVEICSPVAACGIKSASPIQNLGGLQTYLRRYLFTSTFGIAEHDMLEEQTPDGKVAGEWKENATMNQPAQPLFSAQSKDAYLSLIAFYGYHKEDRDSEKNKAALETAKKWMSDTFGSVLNPLQFTQEQVDRTYAFLRSQGPESFVDDQVV